MESGNGFVFEDVKRNETNSMNHKNLVVGDSVVFMNKNPVEKSSSGSADR